MSTQDLESLAAPLVAAASRDRHEALIKTIGEIRSTMNSGGVFYSSAHVNEVCKACADALRDIARATWDAIQRTHKAQGSSPKADVFAVFQKLLDAERIKIEIVQGEFLRPVLDSLQNKSMQQTGLVTELHSQLVAQYEAEAKVYKGTLLHGPGTNLTDIVIHKLKNNRFFAFLAIVVAIVSTFGVFEFLRRLAGLLQRFTTP